MYEINSEMRLTEEFHGPIAQQDAVLRTKKSARHKLIVDYKSASRTRTENAPRGHGIYGIREVMEEDEMFTWIKRAHIDHRIFMRPKSWDTLIKADRTLSYDFISSMEPPNIIHDNKKYRYLNSQNLMVWVLSILSLKCADSEGKLN